MSLLESILYIEGLTPKQQQAAMEWENLVPQVLSTVGLTYGGEKGESVEGDYVFQRTYKGYAFDPAHGEKVLELVRPVLEPLGYKDFRLTSGEWNGAYWNIAAKKSASSWLQINGRDNGEIYLKLNFK